MPAQSKRHKRGRGKPTKLTPRTLARALSARRCGLTTKQTCMAMGITRRSHDNWMARGEADVGAGRTTIYAEYFLRIPGADLEGKWLRLRRVQSALRKGDALAVARAKAALQYEVTLETGRMGAARRQVLRAAAGGSKAGDAPPQEAGQPADLSRLTDEKLARYTALTTKAREDITAVTAEEFLELQALLRETRQVD